MKEERHAVNPWSRLIRTCSSLFGRGPIDRDLGEEVEGYLDMLTDERIAGGMQPDEARRQARLEFGGVEQVKESVRAGRPAAWLDHLGRDLRYGARLLRRTPAASLTAVLILGLGLAANVAMFGLVNILLLQPRVGSERPGGLVGLYVHDPATADSYRAFSYLEYQDLRRRAVPFSHLSGHDDLRVVLSDGSTARKAQAELITADYFAALGVNAVAGRVFTEDECRPGSGATVAVASGGLADALGGPAAALGRTLSLNSRPFTIVGVAPAGFSGTMVAFGPAVWIPLGAEVVVSDLGHASAQDLLAKRSLEAVGRLKPGVAVDAANAALRDLSGRLDRERLPGEGHELLTTHPLARTSGGIEPKDDAGIVAPLGMLMGMAGILLLVASLNVANLQLAKGTNRRREIAMRLALGAPRLRVASQLLAESLLLSLSAGLAGLLLGAWILKVVVSSFSPLIGEATAVVTAPDWRVCAAALAFSVLSAAVFALAPAWKMARLDLVAGLQGGNRGDSASAADARLGPRHLLVAGQVALSLALLSAAGLFVRAALVASRAEPGYAFAGQLLARVDVSGQGEARQREALRTVLDRLRALPGVESASVASLVAFTNESHSRSVGRADHGAGAGAPAPLAQQFSVGSSYFRALGVPVLRGREFTAAEEQGPTAAHPVVIDEPLARALFGGEDPVGRQLAFPARAGSNVAAGPPMEVVGVVPGLRHRLTDRGPVMHVYHPVGEQPEPALNFHVRLAGGASDTAAMLRAVQRTIHDADERLAILGVTTLDEARDASPQSWLIRTAGQTLGALGVIGLGMAVAGLYGVKAYLVARRTREIGIRLALGASPSDIIAMVLGSGSALLVAGLLLGVLGALGAGLALGRLLVGVRPLDPLVLGAAASALTTAVLGASYLPARRATRVAPAVALRTE